MAGFECWKKDHDKSKRKFFGLPYILLHSLSHLLITVGLPRMRLPGQLDPGADLRRALR